jgi:hypothetical protein
MSFFDKIDLSRGELPGWINNLVALARPLAITMTVSIAPMGAFSVGAVAYFDPKAADAMASASIKFLQGIPDAGWGAIVAIALGYTAAKTAEVVKHGPAKPLALPAPDPAPAAPGWSDAEMERLRAATPVDKPVLPEPTFGREDDQLPDYAR